MAMQFYQAQRPETPDYLQAEIAKGEFEQQRANADQLRRQNLMSGIGSTIMGAKDLGLLGTAAGAAAPASAASLGATAGATAGTAAATPALLSNPIGWGILGALTLSKLL